MTQTSEPKKQRPKNIRKRWRGRALKAAAILLALCGAVYWWRDNSVLPLDGTSFEVRRGPLEITILEGGSIEALESLEIKSEVQGETKILTIVDEGYSVTEEDIEKSLVLVELDATKLRDQQIQQELEYQNASASNTQAREQYEIQQNDNISNIQDGALKAKFAKMDFQKYLGQVVAEEIISESRLEEIIAEEEAKLVSNPLLSATQETAGGNTSARTDGTAAAPGASDSAAAVEPSSGEAATVLTPAEDESQAADGVEITEEPAIRLPEIDFGKYADAERLGNGEAGQQLRKLEDALVLAEKEVGLAQSKLQGTQRLFEKEFVTRDELENDEMALRRSEIALESARISKELFILYEFPKSSQKLLSDYAEALRRLRSTEKQAVSKLAQAEAQLKSAEARFTLQTQRRKEIQEQIEKCVIRATKPGLVVYGAQERHYYDDERIEEGASVRERQSIITIPDTRQMCAEVKVHEAQIERVQKGLKARIRVEAHPEVLLTGEVHKIGVLPDTQNRWMNPELKVYSTTVTIEGKQDWLKPGLSAEIEIIVDKLDNVLYVPIQAVRHEGSQRFCYVQRGVTTDRRPVETGAYNDIYIEIKSGLEEGERVLLLAPDTQEKREGDEEAGEGRKGREGEGRPEGGRPERGAKESAA